MIWREKECDEGAIKALVDSRDGLDALRARVLAIRGVTPETLDEYFAAPISALSRPDDLPGAVDAAAAILRHVEAKGKIVVFGDYDCDGICAAAILHKAIEAVSPGTSTVFLPDRLGEGYGMSEKSVGRMLSENPGVTLVVTVDNGIGSADEVRLLSEKGVECVVTDHHLPGEVLPECIVVDPKVASTPRTDTLCGAGVAFMLAGALVRLAREKGIYEGANIGGPLLVLAGIATVGDIMPLSGDNRIIVRESLARFWRYAPPGVKELLARALRTTPENLTSVDYAFRIVPRINADGRLASGMDAMKLVMTDNREEARRLAVAVDARNVERKSIEQSMSEKAFALVEKDAPAQVIEITDGHKGVVGIVASRVMDSNVLGKRAPVAIAVGRHGSVRAPEGYNARDALAAAAVALDHFGGHAAAGGFTVKEGMFAEFKRLFREACAAQAAAMPPGAESTKTFDAWISPKDVTLDFAKWIKNLEPFGEGNPEPLFALKGVYISNAKPLGADGKHVSFSLKTVPALRCVWWGHGEDVEDLRIGSSFSCDIAFRIAISNYGEPHPELEIVDMGADWSNDRPTK